MQQQPKLKEAIKALSAAVSQAMAVVEAIDPSDINSLAKAFKNLKDAKELLKVESDLLGELYNRISQQQFPFTLEQFDLDAVKIGGYHFGVSERTFASIPQAKRELGHRWVREVLGTPELIKETVNTQQLSPLVKAYFDTNAKWPPKEAVSVHIQQHTSVRKA